MTLRVATASVIDVDMGCWPLQWFVKTGNVAKLCVKLSFSDC